MSPTSSTQVLRILVDMVEQRHASPDGVKYAWQVRHSGLLGLKYFVAVKRGLLLGEKEQLEAATKVKMEVEDVKPVVPDQLRLLKSVVSASLVGIRDRDDDVRSAGAATLLPLADVLVEQLSKEMKEVVEVLWECLGDLKDDLASSVGGVMDLLAKLLGFPAVIDLLQSPQMQYDLLSVSCVRSFALTDRFVIALPFPNSFLDSSLSSVTRSPLFDTLSSTLSSSSSSSLLSILRPGSTLVCIVSCSKTSSSNSVPKSDEHLKKRSARHSHSQRDHH